jgi:hypothetical protein
MAVSARAHRDADAGIDVQGHPGQDERVAERDAQPAGDLLGAQLVGTGQEDGELVATHPGQQVAVLQGVLEPRADQAEQVVADAVPETVVHLLEAVQVDHEDGARPRRVAVDHGLQFLDEPPAVGQAGQRVLLRLRGELGETLLLDRPQLGVLDDEGALEGHLAHGLAHRRGPVTGLADRAGDDEAEEAVAGEQRHADVGLAVEVADQPRIEEVAGRCVGHEDREQVLGGAPPQRDVGGGAAEQLGPDDVLVGLRPVHVQDRADAAVVAGHVGRAAVGAGEALDRPGEHRRGLGHPGRAGAVDEHLPDDVGGDERGGPRLTGAGLVDDAAQVGAGGHGEPAHVLGEGPHLGAVEGQHADEVRTAAERHRQAGGDVEVLHPPVRQQAGVAVAAERFPRAQNRLGEQQRLGRVAELLPGGPVLAAVGVAGHPGDEAPVLEQEDAGALHLAQLGELTAGAPEQVVHGLRLRGGLDQAQQHFGLRRAASLGPAGPRLREGGRELRGHLAEQVRRRGRGRLHGEHADDLAVAQQRLAVGGADPAHRQLLVRGPATVRPGHEGLLPPDHRGQERGGGEGQRGAQLEAVLGVPAGLGDDGAEGHRRVGGGLVDPHRDAGRSGRGAHAREQVLQGRLGIEGGRRRGTSRSATSYACPRHAIKIGDSETCLSRDFRPTPFGGADVFGGHPSRPSPGGASY